MAENDQEKTEFQSQKRLEQSRQKGELPRSQEINTFVVYGLFIAYFSVIRTGWFDSLGSIMADMLDFSHHSVIDAENLGEFLLWPALRAGLVLAPLLGLIMVLSPLTAMLQTGFNIASEKLAPAWERLDPVAGARRLFSLRAYIEGAKSCVKILLFGWLAWGAVAKSMGAIRLAGDMDLRGQLELMLDIALNIGIRISITMAALAAFDFGYQWWEFHKKLRMSYQEMKDEMKEREGHPLIKQRQRSLQMQRARQRMMSEVPKASVVVTNPTHYAVALTYNRDKVAAPYVCAKGVQYMAARIRELAKEHGVPMVENRPLARALYRQVKVNQIIPSEFYKAVAEVLAFVYLLKQKRKIRRTDATTQSPQRTSQRTWI